MSYKEISKQVTKINNWDSFLSYHYKKGNYQRKSSKLSMQARNEADNLYNQKNHDEKTHHLILKLYTKSIAFAVKDSEEQAAAYSNRSVLLMHLRKYKECLVDVSRACKITKSEDLKNELLLRKEKCLTLMKRGVDKSSDNLDPQELLNLCPEDTTFFANLIMKQIDPKDVSQDKIELLEARALYAGFQKKLQKLKVPSIELPNETIPNFSESITLDYNTGYGRHILATRDIEAGEILVVEKGFVSSTVNKIYATCSYCLNFCWNGIPCDHCVFAVYCSENCKVKAWQEYHDIECPILPLFFSEDFQNSKLDHQIFTFRLFITFVKSEGLLNMITQSKSIDNDICKNHFVLN